jgi:hypothetical protein
MTPGSVRSSVPQSGDRNDFSLVLGGPLFQLLLRARLTGNALELLHRRIVAISCFTWVPLLALSVVTGVVAGTAVKVPFLYDIETHIRFLVALPLLILGELIVHERMGAVVGQFVSQGLVPETIRERFDSIIKSALQLRNSVLAETLIIAFVYIVGILVVWRCYTALDAPTWYAAPQGGRLRPHLAGWWYLFVSLPVFQFILLRWYFRLFIWTRFLWQVSRLPLAYAPMHPDRMGGIGFLSNATNVFWPLLVAQGALVAGVLANRIVFDAAVLTSFKLTVVAVVAVVVIVILGPLLVFVPPLTVAKRAAVREYGLLARRYVDEFDGKWLRGQAPRDEPLIGSADIQSLADLANSFEVVRSMRILPVTRNSVFQLVAITLLPIVPLLLTMFSPEELLRQLLQIVF